MSDLAGHTDIDTVRDATDLVRLIGEHVALRPKGREHVGLCPFHNDKNPSFCVVTHKGNAFYKCHSCGAGGDAFDFVMNFHRMEFGEALRLLADRAGVKLQPRPRKDGAPATDDGSSRRTELRKANAFAATFFQRMLNDQAAGAAAREVISTRGINDEMVQAFMLGAAPAQWDALLNRVQRQGLAESLFVSAGLLKPRKEGNGHYDSFRNRLIFPICDDAGAPIAFGARKIDPNDDPKYLNSAESPLFSKSKTLYGLHRAKRSIIDTKQAIVTEGYTDVIACHQAGITNVVGTLGTALTRDHARILSRLCETVYLVFDGDEAGQKAADRGLEVFFTESVDIKICVLPDELDPDELLKQPDGRERFMGALAAAVDALEFKLHRFRSQLETASGISARNRRLTGFLTELSSLGFASLQGVKKRMVLASLADLFGVTVADIESALPKTAPTRAVESGTEAEEAIETSASPRRAMSTVEVLPARRRAEEQVLSILIYQPELADCVIATPDGREDAFLSVCDATHFADGITSSVAESLFTMCRNREPITVQRLLAAIVQPEAKQLVSALYFHGERSVESARQEPAECLRDAVRSLFSHITLTEFHQTVQDFRSCKDEPDQALVAAQSVIERRRRQGHIASAIVRGVRS